MGSNMIIDITQEYVKAVDMANSWFQIEIRAKISKNKQIVFGARQKNHSGF